MKNFFIIALVGWMVAVTGQRPAWAGNGAGEPERGAKIYDRCIACHSLTRNRTGPKHCGLFGRTAGTLESYRYSKAMGEAGIVWDNETLDAFLKSPRAVVPGTKMGYAGIKDAQERTDLIAYLRRANEPGGECS